MGRGPQHQQVAAPRQRKGIGDPQSFQGDVFAWQEQGFGRNDNAAAIADSHY
jgi:hypothetical protein